MKVRGNVYFLAQVIVAIFVVIFMICTAIMLFLSFSVILLLSYVLENRYTFVIYIAIIVFYSCYQFIISIIAGIIITSILIITNLSLVSFILL